MVCSFKRQKGITINNVFQKMAKPKMSESRSKERKPNKIRVDKGSEFHNRSMKSWLQNNDIKLYSTGHEEKSNVAEKFIRTFKKQKFINI